jgi:polysaccharide pyruvyl transferase WcaK-like protein
MSTNTVLDFRRRRIVLFGMFGIGNLGNESTLWVTLHHLRKRLPDTEVLCVSDSLPIFAQAYDVTGISINSLRVRGGNLLPTEKLRYVYVALASLILEPIRFRRAIRLLQGVDRFIVVGTGALDDLGQQPWELPTYTLRWCTAARWIGAKVQLLAVGAGPIRGRINRLLTKRAVAMAETRAYRDVYSRQFMGSLGVTSNEDEVVPDLVFAFPTEWLPTWRDAAGPPKVIGVGVMEYYGWNLEGNEGRRVYTTYISKMAAFIRWLLDSGYSVRLLIGERVSDARALRDLQAMIGVDILAAAGERVAIPPIETVQDLLREIVVTDMVVGTRFHNLVFALALARPVISVGYAPKFDALMHEMGLDAYSQHIERLDLDRLKEQIGYLAANHRDVVLSIEAKRAEYRERLERLYDLSFPSAPAFDVKAASLSNRR